MYCIEIVKQLWPLRPCCSPVLLIHAGIHVSIRNENIERPLLSKIYETSSPGENGIVGSTRAGRSRHIGEQSVAVIVIKRICNRRRMR